MASPDPSADPNQYVLGTGRDELERLAMQHRLWGDAAHDAWKHARIQTGMRVLDVGCGPGHAAFDLGQLVSHTGEVVGVDESAGFIAYLNQQAHVRSMSHVRGVVGDVQSLGAALMSEQPASFDAAYARWVLCFVPRPRDVVAGVARLLKPGGRIAVHDYFNYTSMTMAPRRRAHDAAVAATARSWRDRGGDPDVVGSLPRMLMEHGFTVERVHVHQRLALPGSTMYQWPLVWWRTYAPKLVQMGYLERAMCDELLRDLDEIAASEADFIVVPPVFEVVAVKK